MTDKRYTFKQEIEGWIVLTDSDNIIFADLCRDDTGGTLSGDIQVLDNDNILLKMKSSGCFEGERTIDEFVDDLEIWWKMRREHIDKIKELIGDVSYRRRVKSG